MVQSKLVPISHVFKYNEYFKAVFKAILKLRRLKVTDLTSVNNIDVVSYFCLFFTSFLISLLVFCPSIVMF